jgi:hypothetical protein
MRSLAFLAVILFSSASLAEGRATFALVIGTNDSVDKDLEKLRYADDDAARSFDLFRSLGARTYLLARLDDDTARLHPQAAAEAMFPVDEGLTEAASKLAGNIAVARARGLETVFYVMYAGHGNVDDQRGYITLEDKRLFGDDLIDRIIDRVGADQTHLIVDACYSYFLAYGRGPGGARRPVEGFSRLTALADEGKVGLILSTSSAAESHEWEAFQAGVFSHEIRSGLYGAADADGDGVVSYREISAFVDKANRSIPNERFRPKLHARAPTGTTALVDIAEGRTDWIEVDGARSGHYMLETELGVRLVDFHNAPGQQVKVFRPKGDRLFLRHVKDDVEYELPASGDPIVKVATLTPQPVRVQGRGAAHHSFSLLFQEPFSVTDVMQYSAADAAVHTGGWPWASIVGIPVMTTGALVGVVGLSVLAGATYMLLAAPSSLTQVQAAEMNQTILALDAAGVAIVVVAAALAGTGGAFFILLPENEGEP